MNNFFWNDEKGTSVSYRITPRVKALRMMEKINNLYDTIIIIAVGKIHWWILKIMVTLKEKESRYFQILKLYAQNVY